MTREELDGLKAHYPDRERHADIWALLNAIEALQAKLSAWEHCGLTEEMLRNHDGYLTINRGVVLASEHYLAELEGARAERDLLRDDHSIRDHTMASHVDHLNTVLRETGLGEYEVLSIMSDLRPAIAALTDTIVRMRGERDEARQRIAEVDRGEYICKKCGLRKDGGVGPVEF